MRLIRTYIYLIVIFTSLSCARNKGEEEIIPLSRDFVLQDLTITELELLEVEDELHPLLDSIINFVVYCPDNQNKQIGFIMISNVDSVGISHLTVENVNDIIRFDYSICNGVFYYRGYQFAVIGNLHFFKSTDNSINIVGVNPEKLITLIREEGEFYTSYWAYIYLDEKFHCISYHNCGDYWYYDK